jgi:hypothetical protein
MKRILFSHFLNEEILLPNWLIHHRKLFTHGILLDSGSTDRSVQIIKKICPTWDIVKLAPEQTSSPVVDIQMIQYYESQYKDVWKCALNVSEYLIIDNLELYIDKFQREHPNDIGFRVTGVILVDNPTSGTELEQFSDINLITLRRETLGMDSFHIQVIKEIIGQHPLVISIVLV